MKKVWKDKWLKALRSRKFKQTRGKLERIDKAENVVGNCCLGVLCRIAKLPTGVVMDDYHPGTRFFYGKRWAEDSLTDSLLRRFGLTENQMNVLIDMNDNKRRKFYQIARWIERNL